MRGRKCWMWLCVNSSPPLYMSSLSPSLCSSPLPLLSSSRQTDRSGWLTRFREVKLRWCHLDRQSRPVNTAGMASDFESITLKGWQRCEVMSACDEIIIRAHLPACDVTARPWHDGARWELPPSSLQMMGWSFKTHDVNTSLVFYPLHVVSSHIFELTQIGKHCEESCWAKRDLHF